MALVVDNARQQAQAGGFDNLVGWLVASRVNCDNLMILDENVGLADLIRQDHLSVSNQLAVAHRLFFFFVREEMA